MKSLTAAAALCLLLLLPAGALAQTRTRRSSSTAAQKRRTASTAAKPDTTQINTARIKLADQVKTLSRFLYLYGRFSKDLELSSAQTGASDVAARTRASLLASLKNVREGLDQLESQFRFTPGLERPYAMLRGAAQHAADAEASASAGRFDQAGRTLVEVVTQLTDVLVEM
ncbi:MAG: hypothetical protein ACJ741_15205 [Pyrinomonadaceae bacterium]